MKRCALFEAADHGVTRREFQIFADRILEGHPAVLSVSWIPRVRRYERLAHEQAAVADGIDNYHAASARMEKSASRRDRDEYFPLFYTSERNAPRILGFDLADGGMRENTMDRSQSLVLQTGTGNRRGFFVGRPVEDAGASTSSSAAITSRPRVVAMLCVGRLRRLKRIRLRFHNERRTRNSITMARVGRGQPACSSSTAVIRAVSIVPLTFKPFRR